MTGKYEALYENMKKRFTVENEGSEYTLGEYMLMKANKNTANGSALPVAVSTHKPQEGAVRALVS